MASKPTIQRGSKALGTATSVTVVRGTDAGFDATVDPTKTMLLYTVRSSAADVSARVRVRLVDGDTITIERTGTATVTTVEWQLVSFASGVTVQHKTATIAGDGTATAATVSITGAGSGGRFIVAGGVSSNATTVLRLAARWRFTSDTEIEASVNSTSATDAVDLACQVVEWDTATVEVVTLNAETWASTTLDKTISAVTAGQTVVFGTGRVSTNGPADMNVALTIPSATTLRLIRDGATSRVYTATIYVVSISDGVAVQRVETSHAATGTADASITAVTTADAVLSIGSLYNGASWGVSSETSVNRLTGAPSLTSATNLRTTRDSALGNVTYTTQVIEFSEAAPPAPSGARIVVSFRPPA